jgi:hypothetical protein
VPALRQRWLTEPKLSETRGLGVFYGTGEISPHASYQGIQKLRPPRRRLSGHVRSLGTHERQDTPSNDYKQMLCSICKDTPMDADAFHFDQDCLKIVCVVGERRKTTTSGYKRHCPRWASMLVEQGAKERPLRQQGGWRGEDPTHLASG